MGAQLSKPRATTEHQTETATASAWPACGQGQHLPVRADALDQISTGSQRNVNVYTRFVHATALRPADSESLHCAVLRLISPNASLTRHRTSAFSWFNCKLDRNPDITKLIALAQTSASPGTRGLNALETNSPSYPKISLQHGPLPPQKLQQGQNHFHFDDLLVGQLKKSPSLLTDARTEDKANIMGSNPVSFGSRKSCSFYQSSPRLTLLRTAQECCKIVYSKNSF